jgi:hypothetical protein
MIWSLTKKGTAHFLQVIYSYGYPLDSRLVLPSTGGATGAYGYWMDAANWRRSLGISSTRLSKRIQDA